MKDLAYQRKAVEELTEKTIALLNDGGLHRKLVFDAPTGSGKTVMVCQALANMVETLHADGTNRYEEVAFIWFAPRKLHLQSYGKLRGLFDDSRQLRPVMFDELDRSAGIRPGEILFVNWESVNKENNLLMRDGESSVSLHEICRRTREEERLPIIAVIDEEHMYWSKTADKSAAVLDKVCPAVEIRVSATPKTTILDEKVNVYRKHVIDAGMIKREVILNPEVDLNCDDERTLNEHLIKVALYKREQLAAAYRALDVNINPLLLIQLPNDSSETMSVEDSAVAEQVKNCLREQYDITAANGRLAVWLAGEKENLAGLERPDNMVQVLLFKEAIALGWDCPRAAVLLIFRKLQSNEFTVQTVGRILRMPEQHHYTDERLNIGYVYTDVAKEKISIVSSDAGYIRKNVLTAHRRDGLHNVVLKSVYRDRPNKLRNYLGPDFRSVLYEVGISFWELDQDACLPFPHSRVMIADDEFPETDDAQVEENRRRAGRKICFEVSRIKVPIPKNVHFQNDEQTLDVAGRKAEFARTSAEIDRAFISHIAGYLGAYEKKNSPADKLAGYLLEMLADFFGIFDIEAKKVVMHPENQRQFDHLIRRALQHYDKIRDNRRLRAENRAFVEYDWEVPEERVYDDKTHRIVEVRNHALSPFVELNTASQNERRFIEFLEDNSESIDWWYKNGDSGCQHFSIEYTNNDGMRAPFYVDFIIRLKNGKVFLFDTKTEESDENALPKHNALIDYIAEANAHGANLSGGIIFPEGDNWLWSRAKGEKSEDVYNGEPFYPKFENGNTL